MKLLLGLLFVTAMAQAAEKSAESRKIATTTIDCEQVDFLKPYHMPAIKQVSQKSCEKLGGKLCTAFERGGGGRWSSQVMCFKDNEVLGAIPRTYQEGKD